MSCITKRRRPGTVSFVRFKLGLSQQQLADTLGVSRSVVAMVETSKREFPRSVRDIYLDLCKSAEELNPAGDIRVIRGRRRTGQSLPSVRINKSSTSIKGETCTDPIAMGWLQQKKDLLRYQHTALQFKKRATEERRRKFSDQLIVVTGMLKVSRELMDKLPEGELRDKYEHRAAVLYAKQVKLKQQLKKCGAVALLQTEHQMKILERQIVMTEEKIAALNSGPEQSKSRITTHTINYCDEDLFTVKAEKSLHYCEPAMMAAWNFRVAS